MIKSFKMLMPFLIEVEENNAFVQKIVFFNFEEGVSYVVSNFEQAEENLNFSIFEEFLQQQKSSVPEIPEELLSVMNVEKDLTKDSSKHIFRRN